MQNQFFLPATGETYNWEINHDFTDGEDDGGRTRPITRIPNTVNNVAAWQQGDEGLYALTLKGEITSRAQHQAFLHWYRSCQYQTIYFTDFDGQKYEGVISSYVWHRIGRQRAGARDPGMADFYIKYTMVFTVMNFLAGDMYAELVNP